VPGPGEVLVKVHAVSLNGSDWETLVGKPLYSRIGGLFRPRRTILGSDIAGRVEAVGPGATRFQPGDDVFVDNLERMGGFAEYVRLRERIVEPLSSGLSHEQASCLPQAGAIALQGIRDRGNVQSGQRVLINGGGGGSGMFAVQLAKLAGAEVTAVDNEEKLDAMRSWGADHVLDYRAVDFTRQPTSYDLILDVQGHRGPAAYRRVLTPAGRYLYVGGSMATLARVLLVGGARVRMLAVRTGASRVGPLAELCRSGAVTIAIDRRYRLEEVPDALRYVGDGHAKGKVVVTVA
jgi:NADPH:quinone reductase-like Zn-dependent oxidoreductase